ncbi:ribosome-associated translation inhibitor RaiA [Patescibacteria group bacterium]|nr:ribosome-associated translation inhibitor RaiA [Patescibacteria group bacterium]
MKVNIKATNIKLTPALKTLIEHKIGNLDKFISHPDGGIQAWVEVGMTTKGQQSGEIYRAEIQITIPHVDKGVRVESTSTDLYAAIEQAKDEMKVELRRLKDKKISLSRYGARIIKDTLKFFKRENSS